MKVLIGWVPIGEDGEPYRPTRGYWPERREPVKVYQTQLRAESYSPADKAAPCYMGESR